MYSIILTFVALDCVQMYAAQYKQALVQQP